MSVSEFLCLKSLLFRKLKDKGASRVVGVDISPAMIEEAKKYEDYKEAGSLIYEVGNAKTYESSFLYDIVTSQYLFPYASTKNDLLQMCQSAYNALKPGGTFVGVSTWLGDMNRSPDKAYLPLIGFKMTWDGIDDGANVHDGMLVKLTLFDSKGQARVTLPNHLWSRESIANAIYGAGFAKLEWVSEECSNHANAEVKRWAEAARPEFGLHGYFVATKE